MAVCLINLDDREKACLGITLAVFCVIQMFTGLTICGLAAYFHNHLQWKILLIEGYNSQDLFITIVSVGLISVGVHFLGSKMCYDCGRLETRKRFEKILWIWVILVLILTIVHLSLSISCFAHTLKVYYGFKTGLYRTMNLYMKEPRIKYKVDKLQLEHECCGSESFHDWMLADWTPVELNPLVSDPSSKKQYAEFYKDVPASHELEPHQLLVVPFSCCDANNMDPCYHDYITQPSVAIGSSLSIMKARDQWWTHGHGLHQSGCAHDIMEAYNTYLAVMGFVFLTAFGTEIIVLLLVRYLDTSISNMQLLGDEDKGTSPGWLCEGCSAI